MPFQPRVDSVRSAKKVAANRWPSRTALALYFVFAAGCGDRPAAPEPRAGAAPATTAADTKDAHARADKNTHTVPDKHAAHTQAEVSLPAVPAQRWPSDAALREGMRRMNQAVAALGHAEHEHLDAAQTSAAAQQVQEAATYMITNCRLAPEPDAALHGLLATLMTGAADLKRDPTNTAPVAAMRDAVALYPRIFEDAAWESDTAGTR